MRVIVKGHNVKLSPDLKSYVTEKILKYEPMIKEPAVCEVVLSDERGPKGGIDKMVRVTLTLPEMKNPIFVQETTSDFFGSIDLAQERLEHQILKYKEQVKIGSRFPAKYWLEKKFNQEEE